MAECDTCPAPEELTLLLLGQTADVRSAELERHLDVCNHCLAIVERLQVDSQLVDLLRACSDS
jgi:hypothetical protein